MSTEREVLAKVASDQGWSDVSIADVLLDYIENQQDPETFTDYLLQRQADENEAEEMLELLVSCDNCGARSEAGWGDTALCLECEDPANICKEHQRTFVDECPLPHDEEED